MCAAWSWLIGISSRRDPYTRKTTQSNAELNRQKRETVPYTLNPSVKQSFSSDSLADALEEHLREFPAIKIVKLPKKQTYFSLFAVELEKVAKVYVFLNVKGGEIALRRMNFVGAAEKVPCTSGIF